MFCSKCGKPVDDKSGVCSYCGVSIAAHNLTELAADKAKAASTDAMQAFKIFSTNPVGGISVAFESLGQARALGVGIAFGIIFALCFVIGAYRIMSTLGGMVGFGGLLKIIVVALVPFVSLFGTCVLTRKIFRGEGEFGHDSYIAGASLLPCGLVAILASILGLGNFEVIALFAIFAFCITILMLFAGLTRICKISEQAATIAVPLMLVVTAWISKVIYMVIL